MKSIALGLILMAGSLAQAKVIIVPISSQFNGLYTAGTYTYVEPYVRQTLDQLITKKCGVNSILVRLDVHYTLKHIRGDISNAALTGTAICKTN